MSCRFGWYPPMLYGTTVASPQRGDSGWSRAGVEVGMGTSVDRPTAGGERVGTAEVAAAYTCSSRLPLALYGAVDALFLYDLCTARTDKA